MRQNRRTLRLVFGLVGAIIAAFLALQSLPAHALSLNSTQNATRTVQSLTSSSASKESRPQCQHLMVYLHGKNAPTWHCLDQSSQKGKVTPNIYTTDCSSSALELYNSWGGTYWTLCFIGNGSANLTSFCPPIWAGGCLNGTWNDVADIYGTGCSAVYFYADINEGGTSQYAPPHEVAYFTGAKSPSGHYTLYDNTLSSLTLLSNCTSG